MSVKQREATVIDATNPRVQGLNRRRELLATRIENREEGGVGVVGDAQKGWTRQLLYGSLVPFDHRTLDSIGLEKSENVWGSIMRVLGGGGIGTSRNPNHDGTKSILPVLAVGDETSWLDG